MSGRRKAARFFLPSSALPGPVRRVGQHPGRLVLRVVQVGSVASPRDLHLPDHGLHPAEAVGHAVESVLQALDRHDLIDLVLAEASDVLEGRVARPVDLPEQLLRARLSQGVIASSRVRWGRAGPTRRAMPRTRASRRSTDEQHRAPRALLPALELRLGPLPPGVRRSRGSRSSSGWRAGASPPFEPRPVASDAAGEARPRRFIASSRVKELVRRTLGVVASRLLSGPSSSSRRATWRALLRSS